ncbi:MAG TPA: hypothetical protein VFT00_04385 [Nocardioides sp.]|nr:hypothetical protein [Nocardioides sp.]
MFRIRIAAALAAALASTALVPAAPAVALPAWEDHATSWTNPDARAPKVVNLRYATHQNFDRVVIDIDGRIPGGRAFYGRNFHYDGSGEPVPIKGRAGISVVLHPAYAHNNAGHSVYDGPDIARPRFDTLKALAFTGDFEGYVSFAFALTHRAEYRVFRLHDPQRLVIDFRH